MDLERLTDQELLVLARDTPRAFGAFYRRHVHAVHGYFRRRVFDVETAFDLTAETFAAALRAVPRYQPRPEPARAWLFGIARHVDGESYAEIAQRLACSQSVVRQRVSRGLRALRTRLQEGR
jgi:DNA-directed RNA polymerase specialized sigma24 family protein